MGAVGASGTTLVNGAAPGVTVAGGAPAPGGVAASPDAAAGGQTGAGTDVGAAPGGGAAGSASGVAHSGVACGPGVRQVAWTPYAPPCVAAFSGDNGGATAPGVTAKEITVVIRTTEDWEAFQAGQGEPSFEERVADTKVLVELFNKQFELYGRRVVIKEYVGDGQVSQRSAEAARRAHRRMRRRQRTWERSRLSADSCPSRRPRDRRIIHIGTPYSPSTTYKQYSPYLYASPRWMMGLDWGRATAAVVCSRMHGLPAIFAGDSNYRSRSACSAW